MPPPNLPLLLLFSVFLLHLPSMAVATSETITGVCYVCYNCKTFEAASQAKQCDEPNEQFCLVSFSISKISLL